ncbi:uncharacterized protein PHALS_04480 [Plasmopara halstedii]|uniref:Uncharacterized protein n=1 Tax=Plasmopara halstedii TaxID=4781 RepID=A0A0P1A8M2_PLAHL|nr:uncharacterized protein PHALS_04480 [Plasmopara halstedii]CEG37015.1 hypothetical protein PHALS_04480 [Plasmopara halstedii]|eukprot:XP_024573384.1 hypothetical protein PHALS_04480 [Plasmopara halstedii]
MNRRYLAKQHGNRAKLAKNFNNTAGYLGSDVRVRHLTKSKQKVLKAPTTRHGMDCDRE